MQPFVRKLVGEGAQMWGGSYEVLGEGGISVERLLYRNGSEAVEDGCGFVDKRSGSVEDMELFGRGEWGGSVEGDGDGAVR